MSSFFYIYLYAAISIDCPNLRNLALQLKMANANSATMTQLNGDCCLADGITCTLNRVTDIFWRQYNLQGTLNTTLLPPRMESLHLAFNFITGPMPTSWPPLMIYINLGPNAIYGTITDVVWPSGIRNLQIDGNLLYGDVPLLPMTITNLLLGWHEDTGNHFTGTVYLNKPTGFHLNDNWITDIIIADTSALTSCDISNTPLLGNPRIWGLGCIQDAIYSANLLPNTKSSTKLFMTTIPLTTSRRTSKLSASVTLSLSGTSEISTPIQLWHTSTVLELSSLENSKSIVSIVSEMQCAQYTELYFTESIAHLKDFTSATKKKSQSTSARGIVESVSIAFSMYQWIRTIMRILINTFLTIVIIRYTPIRREYRRKVHGIAHKKTFEM